MTDLVLANGLRMILRPRPASPTVDLRLVVPMSPTETAALRVVAASLLDCRRTAGNWRPAPALADAGAAAEVTVEPWGFVVSVHALSPGLPEVLRILDRALRDPGYAPDDVRGAAGRIAASATVSADRRHGLEHLLLTRRFGRHPTAATPVEPGATPVEPGATPVEPGATAATHTTRLLPDGAVLVAVGGFDEATLHGAFTEWCGTAPPAPSPEPSKPTPPDLLIVPAAGTDRATVLLAGPAVGLDHPDHPAVQIASTALAGLPTAHLTAALRDRHRLAYTVTATPRPGPGAPWHETSFACAPADTLAALDVTADVLATLPDRLRDDEIDLARRHAAARPRLATAGQTAMADAIANFAASALPLSLLATFPDRARATDSDTVRDAVTRYLDPATMHGVAEASSIIRVPAHLGPWPITAGSPW